jgi:hypothetical protein
MSKLERELREKLKGQNVTVGRNGSHIEVYDAVTGRKITGISERSSDGRCAEKNFASQLRSAGIEFPRKKQGRKKS